jgi:hypothetical protein
VSKESLFNVTTSEEDGKSKVNISRKVLLDFLESNGYYRCCLNNTYIFVQIIDNVCEPVDLDDMRDSIINEIRAESDFIQEAFFKCRFIHDRNFYSLLPVRTIKILEDNESECYLCFKNGIVRIDRAGAKLLKYSDIDFVIFKSQLIDHELDYRNELSSQFAHFIYMVATGDLEVDKSNLTPNNLEKFKSFRTAIGYLLHGYKNPSNTKAIVAVDKQYSSFATNGRTGKSLLSKAIGFLRKSTTIDGKSFKFDKSFPFQSVEVDTKIINFNDVKASFNFENLFSVLSEDFTFEKKNQNAITIPFYRSPKVYISTNYVLQGEGGSFNARQHILEFSEVFNSSYTPKDHFGNLFFVEWDKEEWNRFYNTMIFCIKMYLDNGLIEFPKENYGLKKLLQTTGEDFVMFMDEAIKTHKHEKIKLYEQLKFTHADYKDLSAKRFTSFVRLYCNAKNITLNKENVNGRIVSNSVEYLTFDPITDEEKN